MTENIAAERVALGVTFLDDTVPNWRDRVDLETFDITDPDNCIVGQVFLASDNVPTNHSGTPWMRGSWTLHDWVESRTDEEPDFLMADYGFEHERDTVEYAELDVEWRKVLVSA